MLIKSFIFFYLHIYKDVSYICISYRSACVSEKKLVKSSFSFVNTNHDLTIIKIDFNEILTTPFLGWAISTKHAFMKKKKLTSESKDVNLLNSIFFFWVSISLNMSLVEGCSLSESSP